MFPNFEDILGLNFLSPAKHNMFLFICSFIVGEPVCALFCLLAKSLEMKFLSASARWDFYPPLYFSIYFKMVFLLISESSYDWVCAFRRWDFSWNTWGGEEKFKEFCHLISRSKNFQKLLFSLSCLPCVHLWLFPRGKWREWIRISWLNL